MPPNKAMQLTKPGQIAASHLIAGVGPTTGRSMRRDWPDMLDSHRLTIDGKA